jgi:hypothetical protein
MHDMSANRIGGPVSELTEAPKGGRRSITPQAARDENATAAQKLSGTSLDWHHILVAA